ncbi:MAG: hypothetical protein HON55_04340 [Legionellales bacterium]|jgi:hypothetical protein|nr:hypothetical protein [Legionellales bacterium]
MIWQDNAIEVAFFMEFKMVFKKFTLNEQIDSNNGPQAFILGLAYFSILGVAHAAAWYFLALKTTLLMTTALPLIAGAFVVSGLYFMSQYIRYSEYFKHRTREVAESFSKHKKNHADELKNHSAVFMTITIVAAIASLILKELLQDISGQLISLTYLSIPVASTAAALIGLFILYLAIKPMLDNYKTKLEIKLDAATENANKLTTDLHAATENVAQPTTDLNATDADAANENVVQLTTDLDKENKNIDQLRQELAKEITREPYFISYFGSFLKTLVQYTTLASGVGYCFAIFYKSFIPNFTIFALSTTLSLVAASAATGFFVGTIAYLCSEKKESALTFSFLAWNLFDSNGENSLRRVSKTAGIIIYNTLWAAAGAAVTFSALYLSPLGIYPQISAAVFLSSLQNVICISMAVQTVFSVFEAALTMHDHGIVNYVPGNIHEFTDKDELIASLKKAETGNNLPTNYSQERTTELGI